MNADGAAWSQYASTATDQLGLPTGTRRAPFDSLDVVFAEHTALLRTTATVCRGSCTQPNSAIGTPVTSIVRRLRRRLQVGSLTAIDTGSADISSAFTSNWGAPSRADLGPNTSRSFAGRSLTPSSRLTCRGNLARILYELRHSFSADLFASPTKLGEFIAALAPAGRVRHAGTNPPGHTSAHHRGSRSRTSRKGPAARGPKSGS
jgi:hypothetical protein